MIYMYFTKHPMVRDCSLFSFVISGQDHISMVRTHPRLLQFLNLFVFFFDKKKAIFLSRLFLFFFQFFDAISKISTYTLLFFLVKLAHCLILELLKAFMYVLLLSLGNSMSSSKKKGNSICFC